MKPTEDKTVVSTSESLLSLSVLLHCRTVVEGRNFVTTGVMTFVEGELFEIEVPEFDKFELGEAVKLTVYSPAGIQTLPSVVFAKYEGAIALLQPPEVLKRFVERREHPRVAITGSLQIIQIHSPSPNENEQLMEPISLDITDISLSGLGFTGMAGLQFDKRMRMKALVNVGIEFSCELEIVRRERMNELLLCGAKMDVIDKDVLRPLRALVLRQQVTKNAEARQNTGKERSFNSPYKDRNISK